jgi:hypothetical protein
MLQTDPAKMKTSRQPARACHQTPTATPGNDVPESKFPGVRGIMHANMIPFLLVIFRLMEQIWLHVEVGNSKGNSNMEGTF